MAHLVDCHIRVCLLKGVSLRGSHQKSFEVEPAARVNLMLICNTVIALGQH